MSQKLRAAIGTAGTLDRRAALCASHASVRDDGSIRFQGKVYTSPSTAAEAAAQYPVDGWLFWKYERAPGDWVRLDELRR